MHGGIHDRVVIMPCLSGGLGDLRWRELCPEIERIGRVAQPPSLDHDLLLSLSDDLRGEQSWGPPADGSHPVHQLLLLLLTQPYFLPIPQIGTAFRFLSFRG